MSSGASSTAKDGQDGAAAAAAVEEDEEMTMKFDDDEVKPAPRKRAAESPQIRYLRLCTRKGVVKGDEWSMISILSFNIF
jgi:hypothetical protein